MGSPSCHALLSCTHFCLKNCDLTLKTLSTQIHMSHSTKESARVVHNLLCHPSCWSFCCCKESQISPLDCFVVWATFALSH